MKYAFSDIYLMENFLLLKEKHKSVKFFETGTWHGETAEAVSRHISSVVTVEVNKGFYDIAAKKTNGLNNVKLVLGNSPDVIMESLVNQEQGLIFFLDAHWENDWPLLRELSAIASKDIKPVIMIHDFYIPDGNGGAKFHYDSYNGQPLDLSYVKRSLDDIYGEDNYTYFYSDKVENDSGVLYVEPKQ